ncbi:hypothetical protein PsYK624_160100 [Phanerochaete sordida]|uniref:Uncharacterized protein n=1 Tax=Phanerochaete sordida TaxID=48140 RepID=A0A9P3GUQ7_9APHY|nr:hypothetical protein PsYK624_160100 [Phanerochaete sordida]
MGPSRIAWSPSLDSSLSSAAVYGPAAAPCGYTADLTAEVALDDAPAAANLGGLEAGITARSDTTQHPRIAVPE